MDALPGHCVKPQTHFCGVLTTIWAQSAHFSFSSPLHRGLWWALGCILVCRLLPACSAPAAEVSYVITAWHHERPVPMGADVVAAGINLDGRVDAVEGLGCGGALDLVSADGRTGIDNQYASSLLAWLEAALGDLGEEIARSPEGSWVLDIDHIDDLRDEVDVFIYEGTASGQRGPLLASATGSLRGEWLEVRLGTLPLPMGQAVGSPLVEHAMIRLRLFPERMLAEEITGELGASVPLETVLTVSRVFEPSLDLASAERMAMPDLDWDGDGACEAVSLGVGFSAQRL